MTLPVVSSQKKIEVSGYNAYVAARPDNWIPEGSPSQGGDYGYDEHLWLESLGKIAGRFCVQLKSTTTVDLDTDAEYISVGVSREVCNVYLRDGLPVLLVAPVLKGTTSVDATVLYEWIDDQIQERLGGRDLFDDSDPATMSFRVPRSNALCKDTDISAYLEAHVRRNLLTARLKGQDAEAALGTLAKLGAKARAGFSSVAPDRIDKWFAHDAATGAEIWPTPKSGSLVAKLKTISDQLSAGNVARAEEVLASIETAEVDDPEIEAELLFQQGRRASLLGDASAAMDLFEKASRKRPASGKYLASAVEAWVACKGIEGEELPESLYERLPDFPDDQLVLFQRVRLCAISGDMVAAEEHLAKLTGSNFRRAKVLLEVIRGDWAEVVRVADEFLSAEEDHQSRSIISVLRVRALLSLVTNDQGYILVGGRADLDPDLALLFRDATIAALESARRDGWPANSMILLDCVAAITVIFGADDHLFGLVSDFARERPNSLGIQKTLARVSVFSGRLTQAIDALGDADDLDEEDRARMLLLMAEAGRHPDVVEAALRWLPDFSHDELVDIAIAMASVSAYRIGAVSEESTFRDFVDAGSRSAQALLRFVAGMLKEPGRKDELLDALWEDHIAGPDDEVIQDNLFSYLVPSRPQDCKRLVELGKKVAARRRLTRMEAGKYSAALLSEGLSVEVVQATDDLIRFHADDQNIALARAVALDRIGQSAAAENLLRRFGASSRLDLLEAHSQLLLRMGDVEAAVSIVKRALSSASTREERFNYQARLASLYLPLDTQKHFEAVWRLGELSDQDDEVQEGTFLARAAIANARNTAALTPKHLEEIHQRVSAYSEKFPKSQFFRVGRMTEGASAQDFLDEMLGMIGETPETIERRRRLGLLGRNVGSHVPFAYRPRIVAQFATNSLDLLRICVFGRHDGEQSRLITSFSNAPDAGEKPVIIDMATFMSLVELDLVDQFFSVWGAVAIPMVSVMHMTEFLFEPLRNEGDDFVDRIKECLKKYSTRILQPALRAREQGIGLDELKTISEHVSTGDYHYLTIDAAAATLAQAEAGVGSCCLTLWKWLEIALAANVVSSTELRMAKLRVASWNAVAVPLDVEDISAIAAEKGVAPHAVSDEDPAYRIVKRFLLEGGLPQLFDRLSGLLVHICSGTSADMVKSAAWVLRVAVREVLMAHMTGFQGGVSDFLSIVAVKSALQLMQHDDGKRTMRHVWSVLESERGLHAHEADDEKFRDSLARKAASLFAEADPRHGISLLKMEGAFLGLLFCLVEPGTKEHDQLNAIYVAEFASAAQKN
ncbi:hypothetical protein LDO26_00095 [Luteimonas sp. BDR2-5]|uniref:hypothetical protein n=1 Tax=Proluteimonas luteida TaxID=2878685 RepID=UPI001E38CF87|nr:hypothetical protein [Luteimonas sp. BDR2-5]MCD9026615.1 hypothetical protein [Luteimonas sp. BDR2-5]